MIDRDLMFMRNVLHGAPVSQGRLARRLEAIDQRLNAEKPPHEQVHHDFEFYMQAAERILAMP